MEGHFVEEGRAECLQAPKAHLSSLPSWRWKSSPQTPTTPDEIPLRAVAGGKAGHPRQSRKENGWNRWGKESDAQTKIPDGENLERASASDSAAPGLDTQTRDTGETAAGNPHSTRPSSPGAGQRSDGTRMGSAI